MDLWETLRGIERRGPLSVRETLEILQTEGLYPEPLILRFFSEQGKPYNIPLQLPTSSRALLAFAAIGASKIIEIEERINEIVVRHLGGFVLNAIQWVPVRAIAIPLTKPFEFPAESMILWRDGSVSYRDRHAPQSTESINSTSPAFLPHGVYILDLTGAGFSIAYPLEISPEEKFVSYAELIARMAL